eukprot:CAMPEP_0116831184 /NCGR_PEP_ID=MMETSP0418-20121206/5196_1 /TAXON_ID=1158023 /ORGANISM="Astrosyne radiata, Strain 13vi08-1A" /LENGTH=244 /DNA_ID=CAMNT_0004460407 /DNA_START=78 /DNA_END=812 /DNA_ORIENTATION=+
MTRFHPKQFDAIDTQRQLYNCTYLMDSSVILDGGITVYGAPWQPFFFDWAFNLTRGMPLREVWSNIPNDTDVLVTHGPPLGRGDLCSHGSVVGCLDLMQEVQERVKPRLHIFGHVHEGYGTTFDGTTLYVNASNLNRSYFPSQHCIVVDLPHDKTQPARVVKPHCRIDKVEDLLEWLQKNGHVKLREAIINDPSAPSSLPIGDALLGEDAFLQICDILHMHRNKVDQRDVACMLSQIHAESFDG